MMTTHTTPWGELLTWPQQPAAVLITGATGFLGRNYLFWRSRAGGRFFVLVRAASTDEARDKIAAGLVECASSYNLPAPGPDVMARIECVVGDITSPLGGIDDDTRKRLVEEGIDSVWHCAANLGFQRRFRASIRRSNLDGTRNVVDLAHAIGASQFVHVSTAYVAGKQKGEIAETLHPLDQEFNNEYEDSKCGAEHLVVNRCAEHGLDYTILRPSVILGPSVTRLSGGSRFGIYGLFSELFRLQAVLSRLGTQIEILGSKDATINLVPVDQVILDMLRLEHIGFGPQKILHSIGCYDYSVNMLSELLQTMLTMPSIKLVELSAEKARSPIQLLFDRRMKFYNCYTQTNKRFVRSLPPPDGVFPADLEVYLKAFEAELVHEQEGATLERHRITADDGLALSVEVAGSPTKPVVVLANAYGMPAQFMTPLARRLASDFRVATWETRWVPGLTHEFDPARCGSDVHASDLTSILDHFGVEEASLVGWSSGVQVVLRAIDTLGHRVRAAILLNGTVSIDATREVPMTDFERNLRKLAPRVESNKRVAEQYCKLIYGTRVTGVANEDRSRIARLLAATDPYLLHMTSAPFRDPDTLYRYAHMLTRMFEEPELHAVAPMPPILVYACRQDLVSHFQIGAHLHSLIPTSELRIDPEGDHFAHFYEDRVAEMIRSFILETPASRTQLHNVHDSELRTCTST